MTVRSGVGGFIFEVGRGTVELAHSKTNTYLLIFPYWCVATKVTPALLLVYFLYKRAWRVLAGATIGLLVFVILIPSLLLGFERNNSLLARMRLVLRWSG